MKTRRRGKREGFVANQEYLIIIFTRSTLGANEKGIPNLVFS